MEITEWRRLGAICRGHAYLVRPARAPTRRMRARRVRRLRDADSRRTVAGTKEPSATAASTRLTLTVHHGRSHATVIEAGGEIDLATGPRLREELLAAVESGTAVLDTADVSFCDAMGLRVLLEAEHAARAHGAALRLAGVSRAVARVLEVAGTDDVFELFPDVETALED